MSENTPPLKGIRCFRSARWLRRPALSTYVELAGTLPEDLLYRHVHGDWGEMSEDGRQMNWQALSSGERLLSAYMLSDNTRVWIITEADSSATTLLLPQDY